MKDEVAFLKKLRDEIIGKIEESDFSEKNNLVFDIRWLFQWYVNQIIFEAEWGEENR